jgi:hypothetical protein
MDVMKSHRRTFVQMKMPNVFGLSRLLRYDSKRHLSETKVPQSNDSGRVKDLAPLTGLEDLL